MKNQLRLLSLPFLLAAGLAVLTGSVRASDENTTTTVKLSDPAKPATLKIDVPWADIHIVGVEGDTVTVESSLNQKGGKDSRDDGLRRLDDEVSFELVEHNNVVSLTLAGENPWAGQDGDFNLKVPRAMALDIKTETGGDLVVKDVTGDIEVNNLNGEVRLEGISGSTVVNTMNGEVHAVYAKAPQKLVSITSMNGEIDLRVPADTKANVRLRTHNGSILTDFGESVLKTKTEGRSYGSEAARIGADAARSAADAARMAVEVAQEFARGVKQEVERAAREGADAVEAPEAPQGPSTPRPPRPPRPPVPPITGGKLVSGTLNGGGVDIKISTMNGEITLRQTNSSTGEAGSASPVTVMFDKPDSFTDEGDDRNTGTKQATLDEISAFVRQTATPLIGPGRKLSVTFLDLDLAGTIRPDKDNIRFMTATTIPRARLKFELTGPDGQTLKEGERKLSDNNYQQSLRPVGRDEPLFYDKQLLRDWLTKEFKP